MAEGVVVSIDTMRASVAAAALEAGAALVNDVSGGLADEAMARVVADAGSPYVVMHWRGHSADMASRAVYADVVTEVLDELQARLDDLERAGVDLDRVVVDPGLGLRQGRRAQLGAARAPRRPAAGSAGRCWSAPPARASSAGCWPTPTAAPGRPSAREDATTAVSVLAAAAGALGGPGARGARHPRRRRGGRRRPRRARRVGRAVSHPEAAAVARANQLLYDAFETGDIDLMNALWLDGPDAATVTCVHPGWAPLHGRDAVLRSWSMIMANTTYIQFVLTDVTVRVTDDVAVVTCGENMLTDLPATRTRCPARPWPGWPAAARSPPTSSAARPDGWRLWLHHASPVLTRDRPDEDES